MQSSLRGLLVCASLVATSAFAVGCAGDAKSGEGNATDDVVIGLQDLKNKVTVEDDKLTFDADLFAKAQFVSLLDRVDASRTVAGAPPIYIVGDRARDALNDDGTVKEGTRNGLGYMRKAISWSKNDQGQAVVLTEKASLVDVAKELQANGFRGFSTRRDAPQLVSPTTREGEGGLWDASWDEDFGGGKSFDLRQITIPAGPFRGQTFANAPLFQAKSPSGEVLLTAKIKTATIDLKPRTFGHVNIGGLRTNDVDLNLTGEANSSFEVEITANLPSAARVNASESGTIPLAKIGGAFQGFPITLEAVADWNCSTQVDGGANFAIGMEANGSIGGGATVKDFAVEMKPLTMDYGFKRLGPTGSANFSAEQRCEITPRISLQIFDAAGPEAAVNVWEYGKLNINGSVEGMALDAATSLQGGGQITFGGALRPFGVDVATINVAPMTFGPFDLVPQQTFHLAR